ncbi:MAG: DUF1553 domain-containing protein [Verrucomicrobiota bacterium]|nr:DUF1553 domain-containing protein [Verrucomicrobiota bacterium]MDP7048572.1 DUF1553 domain-containing protein [Verrucomicrobiota bacterium]
MHLRGFLTILCGLILSLLGSTGGHSFAAQDFNRDVAPLLVRHCLECHNSSDLKGELDLSQKAGVVKGGKHGAVLVAGKPSESLLLEKVSADDMPPDQPLGQAEKKVLHDWIAAGAKWGISDKLDPFQFTTFKRGGYDWWSLQPVIRPAQPAVSQSSWVVNPIDAFILAGLEVKQLKPSAPADSRALIRRLYFDLTGLPPTVEQVAAFEANPTDAAYRRVVDDLLSSPHYGERWGRHWLDLARFGESDGFERNNVRNNLWPYRDWVIRALNDDMAYDKFVRMQIAGDVLRPGDPAGQKAVGFLVAGLHNTVVGGSEFMKKTARQDELEEIIGTVGQTFVGLTVNCARCHNHKFDPIWQREYYRMTSAIAGVFHGERNVSDPELARQREALRTQIASLNEELAGIENRGRKAALAKRKQGGPSEKPEPPKPLARWEFDTGLEDSLGLLHGMAKGDARLEGGALVVDGSDAWVETTSLKSPLRAKTLEAWVQLGNLNQKGGGVIGVQSNDGKFFDSIVFAERESRRWMPGSNGLVRTKSFDSPEENEAHQQPVHIAIVYHEDGTITGYRNGVPHGKPYKTGRHDFPANSSQVIFGMRHRGGGNNFLNGKIHRAQLYDRALGPDAIAASAGVESTFVSEPALAAVLGAEEQARRRALKDQLTGLTARERELGNGSQMKVYTVAARGNPGTVRLLKRGNAMDEGEAVRPGAVAALRMLKNDFGIKQDASDNDRRRELAHWLTHPDNPLFSRVIVNRLWHHHFGTGIVETPNDFGFNGGHPSHPKLLDWLASEFAANGLRLKAMHRLMVTSNTYRQSAVPREEGLAVDAGNRLLWRKSPVRLDAESLRDAVLAVSGRLNPKMGGPGFRDVSITPNNGTTYYEPIYPQGDEFNRRTVYRFSPRGGRSAILDTFDCPDPSTTAPRRAVTTTPLQALALLNNNFILNKAEAMAKRVESAESNLDVQVKQVFLDAFQREPDAGELRLAKHLAREYGLVTLCRSLFNSNEFVILN